MGSWKKGGFLVLCIWVGLEWMESLKCWGTSLVAIRYPRTAWKYFLLEAREGQPTVAQLSSWLLGTNSGRRRMILAALLWKRSRRSTCVVPGLPHAVQAYSRIDLM